MKHRQHAARRAAWVAGMAMVVAAPLALAQASGMSAEQTYRAERAACETGRTGQARQDCLREAGAALQDRRRGRLQDAAPDYRANAAARCDRLPAAQRSDCLAVQATTPAQQGSVEGGGVLRQYTITVPASSL